MQRVQHPPLVRAACNPLCRTCIIPCALFLDLCEPQLVHRTCKVLSMNAWWRTEALGCTRDGMRRVSFKKQVAPQLWMKRRFVEKD